MSETPLVGMASDLPLPVSGSNTGRLEIEYLQLEDLLALAYDLGVDVVRDPGLLASAAARPQTRLYGNDVYPGIADKAAVLLESIVRNHPLIDGNKRLGWLSFVVFLGLNGVDLNVDDDDACDLVIGLAEGRVSWQETASWIAERSFAS